MKLFNRINMREKNKITGGNFFNLALYAFMGFGMELVLVYFIEMPIYGVSM